MKKEIFYVIEKEDRILLDLIPTNAIFNSDQTKAINQVATGDGVLSESRVKDYLHALMICK